MRIKLFVISLLLCVSMTIHAQKNRITIDHYAVLVEDLSVSSNFYQDIIGLDEIKDQTGKEHIRWFSMGGRVELHIIQDSTFQMVEEKGLHLSLRVDDLDAFIEKLRTHKVSFENWFGKSDTTNTRPDDIRQVYFKDPDGYWIEVNGK